MKEKTEKPRKKKDDKKPPKVEPKVEQVFFCDNEYTGIIRSAIPLGPRYFDGVARYTWKGGDVTYDGPFVNSSIEGQGKLSWDNGKVVYNGEVHCGQRHGLGTLQLEDGTKYEGQWQMGLRHGSGTLSYLTGGSYDGEWKNDHKDGLGTQKWVGAQGCTYSGQWCAGHMSGAGKMVWNKNNMSNDEEREEYVGQYLNSLCHGEGTHTWISRPPKPPGNYNTKTSLSTVPQQMNNKYVGQWEGGKRHGNGTFFYANGSQYEGLWKENKKHGRGRFTYEDGSVFDGEFANDRIAIPLDDIDSLSEGKKTLKSIQTSATLTSRKALNIGGEDNPVRQCIDIHDLHMFGRVSDGGREIYNMLLRYLGELRHMYARYRTILKSPHEDPFTLSFAQLWLFCRDCGLITPMCPLARVNRFFLRGSRHEVTPSKFVPGDAPDPGNEIEIAAKDDSEDGDEQSQRVNESCETGTERVECDESQPARVIPDEEGDATYAHTPHKVLLFRHFLEGIPRVALARFSYADGLEHMMEMVLKDHVLPNLNQFPMYGSDNVFAFLVDEEIQAVLTKHQDVLWEMFQKWASNQRKPHISGRMDVTIRIKNVLNMLADALFCADLSVPAQSEDPPFFRIVEKTNENAEAEQGVAALASGLRNLLFEQDESVVGALAQQKPDGASIFGLSQGVIRKESESSHEEAKDPPAEPEKEKFAEKDVVYTDFRLTLMEALKIFSETLSPWSLDKIRYTIADRDASQYVSIAEYCDSEIIFAEFQRFLLVMSSKANTGEHPPAQCLNGFLTYVFLPALRTGYPGPEVAPVEADADAGAMRNADAEVQGEGETQEVRRLWRKPCKVQYPRALPANYIDEVGAW